MSVPSTPPIRSPYSPPVPKAESRERPGGPTAPPDEPHDEASVDGKVAGAALIGLLLPSALLPTPGLAAETPPSQSMPVRRQEEELDFSNGAITFPVRMPGPVEVHELEPLPPTYLVADDGSAPAVMVPEHPGLHYAQTEPLVDAMLEPDLPAAWRNALRRDMGAVPAPLLRKVVDAGTRVWIVPDGVTEAPARIFKADAPADPAAERFEYQGRTFSKNTGDEIRYLNKQLSEHRIDGLYIPSQRIIVIREVTLKDPAQGQGRYRVAVHELAHAVDHVMSQEADYGERHRQALEAIHKETAARGDEAFITAYARTNPTEHYADGFEAYFTVDRPDPRTVQAEQRNEQETPAAARVRQLEANHDDLKERAPALYTLIEGDIAQAARTAPRR